MYRFLYLFFEFFFFSDFNYNKLSLCIKKAESYPTAGEEKRYVTIRAKLIIVFFNYDSLKF